MDYENKYKEAFERANDIKSGKVKLDEGEPVTDYIFPELKESEDEKIRKAIIESLGKYGYLPQTSIKVKDAIAWLEKQGEKPNYCHHEVDLSGCSEEYRKAYYDGWNNCNMQHSQCISEGNDVVKCLINGMKFYYEGNEEATWGTEKFSMKVKDILNWLEKQGEQKVPIIDFKAKDWYVSKVDGKIRNIYHSVDKIEPKFKVGDWVVLYPSEIEANRKVVQISRVERCQLNMYWTTEGTWFGDGTDARLWTIEDAKDGDVLVASDGSIFLFKDTIDCACRHYVALITDDVVEFNEGFKHFWETSRAVHPATKEQHDLLFQKMKEAGYEWDAEKKELKKIEQKPAWSEEDEKNLKKAVWYVENPALNVVKDIMLSEWFKSLKDRYA